MYFFSATIKKRRGLSQNKRVKIWRLLTFLLAALFKDDMETTAKVKHEPGEKNFSCYMYVDTIKAGVLGQGNSARAAMDDMLHGWDEMKTDMEEDGIEVPDIEVKYAFDIGRLY